MTSKPIDTTGRPYVFTKARRDGMVGRSFKAVARYRKLLDASPAKSSAPDESHTERLNLLLEAAAALSRTLALETSGNLGDERATPEMMLRALSTPPVSSVAESGETSRERPADTAAQEPTVDRRRPPVHRAHRRGRPHHVR